MASSQDYHVYGARVRSQWALPCLKEHTTGAVTVDLFEETAEHFVHASATVLGQSGNKEDWFHSRRLEDGSDYVRWADLFEFIISPDGRRIAGRPLNGTSAETFQTYLLGQVLSFALLKQGIEPLHATVVVVEDGAIALLGDSGFGKSTLAAAFLKSGHRLLTDDLLVVERCGSGYLAHPGPARIKLFPEVARAFVGTSPGSVPMNPDTTKRVIPLPAHQVVRDPHPLKCIYVLRPPDARRPAKRMTIRRLSPTKACLTLIANTFNAIVRDPVRLKQQFNLTTRLAHAMPVSSISFPHGLPRLPSVVEAIKKDLSR